MRSLDIEFFNTVSNDPLVRPWLGGEGPLDLTPLIRNLDNFAFKNEQGGFLVQFLTGGVYECHTIFKPRDADYQGVISLMKEAQAFMFVHTLCSEIITLIPEGNRGAEALAKLGGFRHVGDRLFEGKPAKVMRLELDAWARMWYGTLEAGRQFHKMLETAKDGVVEAHAEDPFHDRMVGAAVLMIKAGNLAKGVNFYNKWAMTMGWQGVSVASEHPLIVNTGDALIQLSDQMEVLKCL